MDVTPGRSWPLGATLEGDGVNFSIWSRHATAAELCLFDRAEDAKPSRSIRLDPRVHRTYHYWHVHVAGLAPGQHYGWRIHGPFDPAHGYRFDGQKLLLDPYARAVAVPTTYDRWAARPARRQRRQGHEGRGGRPLPLRLGGGPAAAPPLAPRGDLRDAREGLHLPRELGRRRRTARHLRRAGGEDPLPARPGRDRGGAHAGLPVRRPGRDRGAHQLLGLLAGLLLRAERALRLGRDAARARSTSSATWSRRCTGPASR